MPRWFNAKDTTAKSELLEWLNSREEAHASVGEVVRGIIEKVRAKGDAALLEYTAKFDRYEAANASALKISQDELNAALKSCEPTVRESLTLAAERIRAYHEKQRPEDCRYTDEGGTTLGWQWRALSSVGLYVPGGRAAYPSSVLMNAIPAKVAGVKRLVMVVPTPDGVKNNAVLAAACLAGVDEVYSIGGAQAVAALAYGTQSIDAVDKIVGPGNAYVAEAKRQVFGRVGMDTIAGPSEILVVADTKNDPHWMAADLLSQAEHDPQAQSLLITDDEGFAKQVVAAVEETLASLASEKVAREAWENWGGVILVEDVKTCEAWIDAVAPEHLELAMDAPDSLAQRVNHAGAIFLGRMTPEAIGDYIAGPSHVLPTSRAARFGQGLSVLDFMKRTSLIGCTQASYTELAKAGAVLADAEGLPAHALSLRIRLKEGQ